jgi:hypothetical protein
MRMSLNPQEFKELLLSHHPILPCFNDDVILLFKRRVCAGCLLAYPTALVVLILLKPSGYESIFFALVFALLSQLRRLSKNLIIQHLCRIVAGIALGFGLGGGYWAIINGQWLAVGVLVAGAGIYIISKAYSIKSKLMNERTIVPD